MNQVGDSQVSFLKCPGKTSCPYQQVQTEPWHSVMNGLNKVASLCSEDEFCLCWQPDYWKPDEANKGFSHLFVFSHSVVSDSLWCHGLQPTRLLCPWDFPGKNTGADCHFLLRESSQPKDWTWVSYISCTDRQILYHWATWEIPLSTCNTHQNQRGLPLCRLDHAFLSVSCRWGGRWEVICMPQLEHSILHSQNYLVPVEWVQGSGKHPPKGNSRMSRACRNVYGISKKDIPLDTICLT